MTDKKTIAIFGAGTGLGASVAARFGREGYKVALIARGPTGLDLLMAAARAAGMVLDSFPVVDPDMLADEVWSLASERNRAESILPPLPG